MGTAMLKNVINQLDKSAWQADNPEWLTEREAQWKIVEPKLLHGREYSKQDVAKLKQYFMHGENLADLSLNFNPLIEVLYLHPDQSDENLKSIINSFDENDFGFFKYHFYMFTSNIAPTKEFEPVRIFGEKRYGEEGILNGKEHFYSQYFTPDLTLDGKTDAQVKKIKKEAQGFFESFCTDMHYFLLDDTEFNDHKYSFKQYQIATWLQAAPMADYGKKRVVTLICFLHQLYYWRELHPSIETKPERLAFVNTVTDILDNDTSLPSELVKKWQMIKTEQGRYHPKVVEEFKLDRPPELWQKFNLKGL